MVSSVLISVVKVTEHIFTIKKIWYVLYDFTLPSAYTIV